MDLSGFVRRFSLSSSSDSPASVHHLPTKPQGLTVDTSVMKESQPQWRGSSPINISVNNNNNHAHRSSSVNDSPPGSGRTSASATPTSTPNNNVDEHRQRMLQRRRSNSECLMLARDRGGQNLPGPCQEYIAGVKQILARSEESQPALLRRRSSMSLKSSPLMGK